MGTTIRSLFVPLILLWQGGSCDCWIQHTPGVRSAFVGSPCDGTLQQHTAGNRRRRSAFAFFCHQMARRWSDEPHPTMGKHHPGRSSTAVESKWAFGNKHNERQRRFTACTAVLLAATIGPCDSNNDGGFLDEDEEDEEEDFSADKRHRVDAAPSLVPLGGDSLVYDDRLPRRLVTSRALVRPGRQPSSLGLSWGIHRSLSPIPPVFPATLDALAEEAVAAIRGALDRSAVLPPQPAPRQLRQPEMEAPRIGLEIDGAASLFQPPPLQPQSPPHITTTSEPSALREVCLVMARKLASKSRRPVALYFNTLVQALQASRQLKRLRRFEVFDANAHADASGMSPWDGGITVHSLGQHHHEHPAAPELAKRPRTGPNKAQELFGSSGSSEAGGGGTDHNDDRDEDCDGTIVLIVQPTDYNDEYRPPGPAVGAVEALQQLASRSWALRRPTVVISPRFDFDAPDRPLNPSRQGSSDRCPPWILRDYRPPAFTWIAKALPMEDAELSLGGAAPRYRAVHLLNRGGPADDSAWHIFASRARGVREGTTLDEEQEYVHEYLASTAGTAGRPTQSVLQHVFSEFASHPSDRDPRRYS